MSRLERRLVSNLATGAQFLGKESNSHYHAHMACLQQSFKGADLIIPEEVKIRLSAFQKIFLETYCEVSI